MEDVAAPVASPLSLGRPAETVSELIHQINQPLTAIAHYADACRQLLDQKGKEHRLELIRWHAGIMDEVERAGTLLRQLKNCAGS